MLVGPGGKKNLLHFYLCLVEPKKNACLFISFRLGLFETGLACKRLLYFFFFFLFFQQIKLFFQFYNWFGRCSIIKYQILKSQLHVRRLRNQINTIYVWFGAKRRQWRWGWEKKQRRERRFLVYMCVSDRHILAVTPFQPCCCLFSSKASSAYYIRKKKKRKKKSVTCDFYAIQKNLEC